LTYQGNFIDGGALFERSLGEWVWMKMTEEELQETFREFNSQYFESKLTCRVVVTEDWMDDAGNYYPDSKVDGDLFTGTCEGVRVHRASALYTPSKNLISIPKWKLEGEKASRGLLLHEMAHSAANEPLEIDHGPKWHTEMNRLWKQDAPINLQDVTPGHTEHASVEQYGIGSDFWNKL
jgi:hypothetical protein